MQHSYQFQHGHVFLRPLEERDIEALRILRNRNRFFFNKVDYITSEQQKKWFIRYISQKNDIMFAIELLCCPGEFVGAIALYNIDEKAKTAEFGRVLLDKNKVSRKGIGTEAVTAVCRIAFERLGLKKVTAEVLKTNQPAFRAYAKAGCIVVGENKKSWKLEITPDTMGEKR